MPEGRIVDINGNPIKTKELVESQTSQVASLHHEFANHPVRGLTPAKLASILQQAECGDIRAQCELYEDMEERDGHIFAEMQKRKLALQSLDWYLEPPPNPTAQEKKITEQANELLQGINDFEDVIFDMADAIGKSFSCLEFDGWDMASKHERLPKAIIYRPQSWFTINPNDQSEIRLRRDGVMDGEPLNPFGWIVHKHKTKSGHVARGGLHRVLAWPFLFKNYSVRDLAEFLEIYGLPLRLGTYQSGASDEEKRTLMRAVVNIGHAAAGIVPQGMMIDFKEAAKGSEGPYNSMTDWCERTQSKVIVGATLTSQADGKSSTNALGNVHNEVRHDLTRADARQVSSTLTRDLVYPLVVLNGLRIDGMHRCPRLMLDCEEPDDIKLYSEALPPLVDIGVPIPTKHVTNKLRIPEREGDEPILQRKTVTPPELPDGNTGTEGLSGRHTGCPHCSTAALKHNANHLDVADHYINQLDEQALAAFQKLTDPVRNLVANAASLEEVLNGINTMFKDMDDAALAATLRDAFAAAELAGRFEVTQEEK